jgi:hypothetical protein
VIETEDKFVEVSARYSQQAASEEGEERGQTPKRIQTLLEWSERVLTAKSLEEVLH